MQNEAEYWLGLEGHEDLYEKAAKIIEWFLATNWDEENWDATFLPKDSKVVAKYVENVIAELRSLK